MKAYRKSLARIGSVLVLAGALVAVSAARAEATLIVYACDDTGCAGDQFIMDGGAGDTNALAGAVSGSFFGGNVSLTSTTYPTSGTPGSPFLGLTYTVTNSGFASLGNNPYLFAVESGYTGVGSLVFNADASNPPTAGGTATLLGGTGPFSFPGTVLFTCAMDCSGTVASPTAPYYLGIRVQPVLVPGSASTGDVSVRSVPDGGSTAALLGTALVAFGMLRRKINL